MQDLKDMETDAFIKYLMKNIQHIFENEHDDLISELNKRKTTVVRHIRKELLDKTNGTKINEKISEEINESITSENPNLDNKSKMIEHISTLCPYAYTSSPVTGTPAAGSGTQAPTPQDDGTTDGKSTSSTKRLFATPGPSPMTPLEVLTETPTSNDILVSTATPAIPNIDRLLGEERIKADFKAYMDAYVITMQTKLTNLLKQQTTEDIKKGLDHEMALLRGDLAVSENSLAIKIKDKHAKYDRMISNLEAKIDAIKTLAMAAFTPGMQEAGVQPALAATVGGARSKQPPIVEITPGLPPKPIKDSVAARPTFKALKPFKPLKPSKTKPGSPTNKRSTTGAIGPAPRSAATAGYDLKALVPTTVAATTGGLDAPSTPVHSHPQQQQHDQQQQQ